MELQALEKHWQEMGFEVAANMAEWRRQHPKARLREIETTMDQQLAKLRAKMLEEAALMSAVRDWDKTGDAPCCPNCGEALEARTMAVRQLQTHGGEMIALERCYGVCPKCGHGFFPSG